LKLLVESKNLEIETLNSMINLEKNSIKNLEIDLKSFEDLSSKSKTTIQTLQEDNNQLNNKINELEYNLK
jgi:septal ring factor EnvC (AmiA/AmiB activator)